mgnify:CR=1 FL=1
MDGIAAIGSNAATSASSASVTGLADNFDTFLTLLTTQLQNQDPLSPMESNEFTQQLVQFSQVEQSIATNGNLEKMLSLLGASNAANTVALIGKEITFAGGTNALTNGKAKWEYELPSEAAKATITIEDASGKLVYTGTAETSSGLHEFAWDGKDNSGDPLDDGIYTLSVNATDAEGGSVTAAVYSLGQVTGVQSGASEPELLIGEAAVPSSLMLQVNEIPPTEEQEG